MGYIYHGTAAATSPVAKASVKMAGAIIICVFLSYILSI